MMGWAGPWGWQRWDAPPTEPPREGSSPRPPAGAAHLLTLVVTDGEFIQNEVSALPALSLEKRGGNRSALGSGAPPTLLRPGIPSIPRASRPPGGQPAQRHPPG